MIYMRKCDCPHCGKATELALPVLALKDTTGILHDAKCNNCDQEFQFRIIIAAKAE